MMENAILKAILERRSVRAYTQEMLTEAELDALLKAAIYAPSAMNTQAWHFTVIRDQELLTEVSRAAHVNAGREPDDGHVFYHAPVAILTSAPAGEVVNGALARKAAGYQAIKMNGTNETNYIDSYSKIDEVVERMAQVREAVGPDFGIGIDFHGRVHRSMARILAKELEPFRPMFIEEPLLPENLDELRTLVNHTTVPIATGERLYSRWDYKRLFENGLVDIIQPDLSHAGGITEVKKLAAVAESYDVAVAPHCPLGPIALASCFVIDACCHNAVIQEQSLGMQFTEEMSLTDYLNNPEMFAYENGYMKITDAPGLGVDINEDIVREMDAKGFNWKNAQWRNEDGSVAEW